MFKKAVSVCLGALIALFCVSCNNSTSGTIVGAGTGAVVGGVVTNNPVGVFAGAAIGGVLGNVIGGELDSHDIVYLSSNIDHDLNVAYANKYYKWKNATTGTYGELVLMYAYTDAKHRKCGEFIEHVYVKGQKYKATIKACKNNSGKWVIHK